MRGVGGVERGDGALVAWVAVVAGARRRGCRRSERASARWAVCTLHHAGRSEVALIAGACRVCRQGCVSWAHNHLERTTRRGVTHDVEGRQSGAEAAQGRAGA